MKKISVFVLMVSLAIVTRISANENKEESKQYTGTQQQKNQKRSKVRFSLNLKKGFSCRIAYNSEVNITQEGQSDGTGKWKINANLLLEGTDVDNQGIITISQSPLGIWVEGTDIDGKYEIDFNSPEKNLRIPEMIRGHLHGLLKFKSARFDTDGKVIAARQSPKKDDFDFMAMGKISYEDNPEWISTDNPENTETVNSIAQSIIGLFPDIFGKEITIGQTFTTTEILPESDKDVITKHWTVKAIQNNKAQLELKSNYSSERKTPNEFVDEVQQFNSSAEIFAQIDVDTGIVSKCQCKAESNYRIMTFVPLTSSRTPTMSNTRKINYSFEIIEK
jgi:hypothetical protein